MGKRIEFEKLHNVRDLGGEATCDGRTVREGLLFRGDQPFSASDADRRTMVDLGIGKVIDFRSVREHEERPDPVIEGVRNLHLPIIKDVRVGITRGAEGDKGIGELLMSGVAIDDSFVIDHMCNMYRMFVIDPFSTGQYSRFVDEVIESAEAGQGTFWHCTAGKDRAGFASAILLEALGVPRDDIVADYMLTNDCLARFIADFMPKIEGRITSEGSRRALMCFFLADERFLESAYETADAEFGSFDAFLEQAIGIDDVKRKKLRSLLLR